MHAYAVRPDDFLGITPKLLVRVDDTVKAGTPLFFDKYRPQVLFTSPVSGRVTAVNRGEKRRILDIVIAPEAEQSYEAFDVPSVEAATRENVTSALLSSGLWPMIVQRPYGIIADPQSTPKSVFVSGFDSAPLAPDMNFALEQQLDDLNLGFAMLSKLTAGPVHLGLDADAPKGVLEQVKGVEKHYFSGPHPAGNVGVQIHHVDPISKGEIVWTVDIQNVALIGRFFRTGRVDLRKIVALTGSRSRIVHTAARADDARRRAPDISAARRELGWVPRTPLAEGLRRTISYAEKELADKAYAGVTWAEMN